MFLKTWKERKMRRLSILILKTPWGQLNFKRKRDSLFSERNGYENTWVIGPFRFTWHPRRINSEQL